MKLSEKSWKRIGRFLLEKGTRSETPYGVCLTHPKIPFEYHLREPRIPNRDPYYLEGYKYFEWRGRDWVARRTFIPFVERKKLGWPEDGPQTVYEFEGDEGHADEDIAIALLSI